MRAILTSHGEINTVNSTSNQSSGCDFGDDL